MATLLAPQALAVRSVTSPIGPLKKLLESEIIEP
jgi:hypothetical protein